MNKIILSFLFLFLVIVVKSQSTDEQLKQQADSIKNETKVGANTALRIGRMLDSIISNKVNNSKIVNPLVTNNGSDTFATKAYARSVGSGGGSNIDTTRIPFLSKNNTFTGNNQFNSYTTEVSGYFGLNFGMGFSANIYGFENDTSLNTGDNPNAYVPTEGAVVGYINNHSPNLNSYQTISNLSNNVVYDSASNIKYPSVKATKKYIDSIVAAPSYTEYKALLYQTGTSYPKDTIILSNNTGRTFTYNYVSRGYYYINISGSSISQNKFTIQLGGVESPTGSIGIANAWNNNGGIYTGYLIQTYIINPATSAFADGLLYFTPITIRIYN